MQALTDALPMARWGNGENVAKRLRVEHGACISGLRSHSAMLSHEHGEMRPVYGEA